MPAIIQLNSLSKHFKVPVRESGLKASIGSLFKREFRTVKAVDEIGFKIDQGEVVGFLGPNGAGKTTTLKMLSGLLYPTSGKASVLGFEPSRRQPQFLQQITLVMGNRQQLVWDLPALDSFDLMRAIYTIPTIEFTRRRDEFIELLELKDLVNKPVRNLSLGERMKVEIAGALLHQPKVLFLDEPTLGLDVTMQRRIRAFVSEYNRRYGATVLLTSHYMADVEALCKRVIVIHHGKLLFDGELSYLVEQFSAFKTVGVTLQTAAADVSKYGQVVSQDGTRFTLRVPKADIARVTARLLADLPVNDLNVEDQPIEDVIVQVFADGKQEEVQA
jgi:ABC-2 type transport system ATP-binding protein